MNGSPKDKRNSELARNAGISPLTVDRIEKGMSCGIETKRKIILAFGYDLSL